MTARRRSSRRIIVGSLPLFDEPPEDWFGTETPITGAVGTDILARPDCRVLGALRHRPAGAPPSRRHVHDSPVDRGGARVQPQRREPRRLRRAHAAAGARPHHRGRRSPEAVARGADLICLATGSNVPVLFGAWLEPGQHVTSIVASNKGVSLQGSVSRPRREFDDAVIARADRVVATLKEQAIMDEQADLFEPVQSGITSWDKIADLGEVVAGKAPGRRSPHEITVFKQNSDQGVGFMALAKLAHDKARAAGRGIEI